MLTGQTREETRDLAEYARLGAEMAKTVSEISKVNTELIRQGLSLEVARKRMETVLNSLQQQLFLPKNHCELLLLQ